VNTLRIWLAIRLSLDIETCCSLLRGDPVDPSGLDADELEFAKAMRLVSLDTRAIDLFEPQLRERAA
jgi:hypothetical protein